MFSMLSDNGKECNTSKGVNIATELNEFKDTLFNKKVLRNKMRRIQGKKHKLGTYEISKILLSCFHDKRLVLDYGTNTLAYFQKDLKKNRFLQTIIDKKRFSQIRRIQKDSHKKKRFSQMTTNKNKSVQTHPR